MTVENSFFELLAPGLFTALLVTAGLQPLVGILNDHVGVRFSLIINLALCFAFTVVTLIKTYEWRDQKSKTWLTILQATSNFEMYSFLCIISIAGAISLQANLQSSMAYLFGVYSVGRAFTLSSTISRLLALCFVLTPLLLGGGITGIEVFWVLCVLMGLGIVVTAFLNPFSLVSEPEDAIEWTEMNQN